MTYYLNVFTPSTYQIFSKSTQDITGFQLNRESIAKRVQIGDKLLCYVTQHSRWCGFLEVTSEYFIDESPLFVRTKDPFIVRFSVKPVIWLPLESAVSIKDEFIWNKLTFTKNVEMDSSRWTGAIRRGLNTIKDCDGQFLESVLLNKGKKKSQKGNSTQ